MAKPQLSIGLVTFNSAGTVINCLNSIIRFFPHETIEIIVIDNNSDDSTVDLLQDNFLINKLLVNQTNLGFAAAVNRLIIEKEGRHLLLLNPDCELQSAILPMITDIFTAGPRVGIIGAAIVGRNNRPREAYGAFPSPAMVRWDFSGLRKIFPRRRWATSVPFTGASPQEVDYPTGAFYCIRDEALAAERLFDPRFFAYFEEADYAFRLRKSGFRAIVHPSLKVRHLGGRSFEAAVERYDEDFQLTCYFDSLFHFLEKHYGRNAANGARAFIRRFASFKAALGVGSTFGKRHGQVLRILSRLEKSDVRGIYQI